MPWLIGIHIVSILFTGLTIWLMVSYLRRYQLPRTYYKKLWGFFRIKYLVIIYAITMIGWGLVTTGFFYFYIAA